MTSKIVSLIKETAREKNLCTIEYLSENIGKQLHKDRHFNRYFSAKPIEISREIDGPKSEPSVGRGISIDNKPKEEHFSNTAFHDKDGKALIPTSNKAKKTTITRPSGKKYVLKTKEFWRKDGEENYNKTDIPLRNIYVETKDTGKHNDEHALSAVWNYFTRNHGKDKATQHLTNIKNILEKHQDNYDALPEHLKNEEFRQLHHDRAHDEVVDYIHKHIDNAMKDENHDLHISKSDKTHFVHNVTGHHENQENVSNIVRNRAITSYNQNLKDAALSITAIMQHHDFKNNFGQLESINSGNKKAPLNERALQEGMIEGSPSAAYKADSLKLSRITGKKKAGIMHISPEATLSVKKYGGSQIESPETKGFNVLYGHAIDKHFENKNKINGMTKKEAHQKKAEIAEHLLNGRRNEAINALHELHNRLDDDDKKQFTRHVWRAGITGEHKFKGEEGKANYVLIQGASRPPKITKEGKVIRKNKKAKLYHVEHYLNYLQKNGKLGVPDVSESKRAPEDKQKREYPNELSIRLRV